MCFFGDGGAAKAQAALAQKQADEARADTERKSAALKTGKTNIDNAFAGFNDDYFSKLAQNYEDYAKPQLEDQYGQQKKNIIYSLARKGNLSSSVYGDQLALLDKENSDNLVKITGTGQDYATQARKDVQANKNDVMSQLNSSYDADATNTAALAAAHTMSTSSPSFSPLTGLFTNVSALAAQNRLASDPGGNVNSSIGARLFGSRYGSGSTSGTSLVG